VAAQVKWHQVKPNQTVDLASLRDKTWQQLKPAEREAVLKILAEEAGLVKSEKR
jgi:hypothetical protein